MDQPIMSTVSRRRALQTGGLALMALAAAAVLPAALETVTAPSSRISHVVVEHKPHNIAAAYVMRDRQVVVYVNTRLTDERAAVAWAEHRAAAGKPLEIWWGDQAA